MSTREEKGGPHGTVFYFSGSDRWLPGVQVGEGLNFEKLGELAKLGRAALGKPARRPEDGQYSLPGFDDLD